MSRLVEFLALSYRRVLQFLERETRKREDAEGVDIGITGVPWDGGTTNRAGARHGPRQMRDMSTLTRNYHHVSGISPYELANCADLGEL